MAAIVATIAGLSTAVDAFAEEPVATIDWTTTPPISGVVVDGAVHLTSTTQGTFPLAAIDVADLGKLASHWL